MSEQFRTRTFKSGNSVAMRLPKSFDVPEGVEINVVREAPMSFRFEPVDAPKRKIDASKFIGSCPGLEPWPREAFDNAPRAWELLETDTSKT